ncbi:SpoIIE family protein phosphatase [Limibacter armeniacum]|uniref:PP2C family protein-serine/threonine phosphatase n=1 Tax=Limibacter armeniacum TaxID=466084 RepID=UPI002FE564C2
MVTFNNFENRIFRFSCLVCLSVVLVRSCIAFIIYDDYYKSISFYFSMLDLLIIGVIYLFASQNKHYRYLDIIFVIYVIVSIVIHFLLSQGHNGTMPYVQLMAAPLIAALVSWRRILPWLILFFVITIVLHLISHLRSDWIIYYSDVSSSFQMWGLFVYMLSMLTITLVVSILRHNYHVAYQLSITKRQKLEQQRQLLEEQKQQIDQSLVSITESIQYAKKIQNTLLPSENEHLTLFSDSFVFFRPKDIVSGDFYWFTQVDNYKIIVVADCTGHGVPGAFMSVLGYVFLDQIINSKKITSPAEILTRLDRKVGSTLSYDGMDMAICVVDTVLSTLTFAGAKMPLYYVQDGKSILLKGTKKSVGDPYRENVVFENHMFSIDSLTTCYLYSDGFQDQFGGVKKKKFMSKNLRLLLSGIAPQSMKRQYLEIDRVFKEWKAEEEQVDDVLLVGFRIDKF